MTDEKQSAKAQEKRQYVSPKLERLGTIRDLTEGAGKDGNVDSVHPPGQNKSVL